MPCPNATLQQAVLDDNRQAEGDENDQQHVLADHPLQQKPLQAEAEQEGGRQHYQRGDDRIEAERRRQHQQDVAGQDDEIAVGDIDEAQHTGRQRQAGREQRVKPAEQDALQNLINPDRRHRPLTARNNALSRDRG
jgi:hypothetical protein